MINSSMSKEQLRDLWDELTDIPVAMADDGALTLDAEWIGYDAGTNLEEVWHDFDEACDGGIATLMCS